MSTQRTGKAKGTKGGRRSNTDRFLKVGLATSGTYATALKLPKPRSPSPQLEAACARLATLPPDFCSWVREDPPLPEGTHEIVGPHTPDTTD